MTVQISVVMPVYNSEKYISDAIDSVLTQSFIYFEFIIIDDYSTDSSWDIIQAYSKKDKRIVPIKNSGNKGCYCARNIGMEAANGEYIIVMDSDDIAFQNRFQVQYTFMENNSNIDIAGSWYDLFGTQQGVVKMPESHEDIKDTLFFNCSIAHPTVIMRRESLVKFKIKYNETFFYAQDYELWCRESERLRYANIPEVLLKYRVHEAQIGTSKRKEQDEIANYIRKKNLEKNNIILSARRIEIFFNFLDGRANIKTLNDFILAAKTFDEIGKKGCVNFGYKFINNVVEYLKIIAEKGIVEKKTSLNLFFTIFLKWNVFPTFRGKARYIYHSIRNCLIVD